ncbi:MAG: glycosyltransferase [Pseudanabaenaceae cyanobacterium]
MTVFNGVAALWLLLYGLNSLFLTLMNKPCSRSTKSLPPGELPVVTVQLPIYNERYVVQRLLDAVCRLDYPPDRLFIQVLDDSTDDTQAILQELVAEYQAQGRWISYTHRSERQGFKAGALQAGLATVAGEFIAVFDADFVPEPSWLKETISHFFCHPEAERIGVVQTRWGHLNADYSLLTKLQAVCLDGHFMVEQQSRSANNWLLNFNGTAGIWRKSAILSSGGWQGDTLAEDTDLSYRAQLQGWRILFDRTIVAPAELPVAMAAFKLQQFRWAKGTIQCAKKLLPQVWCHPQLSWLAKIQATVHLTGYATQLFALGALLLSVPTMLVLPHDAPTFRESVMSFWGFLTPAALGPTILYLAGQRAIYPKTWWQQIDRVFLLSLLGTGLSLSNSRAVLEGLLNYGVHFRRTPKFNIKTHKDRWQDKLYKLPFDPLALGELALCVYGLIALVVAWQESFFTSLPYLLMYTIGYGYVGGVTLWQAWQQGKAE